MLHSCCKGSAKVSKYLCVESVQVTRSIQGVRVGSNVLVFRLFSIFFFFKNTDPFVSLGNSSFPRRRGSNVMLLHRN